MRDLPSGTVTFVFTDIEHSTHLLESLGERYAEALHDHRRILRQAVSEAGGREVDTQGDAFFAAFSAASDGVAAAVSAQRALWSHPWPGGTHLRVRMGIHTGEPTVTAEGYVGLDVHRGARICSAGHGGQILISQATRDLVGDRPGPGARVRDLGRHRLKDLTAPQRLFQLVVEGLPGDFPPLRTLDHRPTNLPPQATPLVGREREVAEVTEALAKDTIRLLTLTGPGGAGKTRLALQAAADLIDVFPDGVFFVPLADITDPGAVVLAIAQSIGLRESAARSIERVLGEYFRDQTALLVLDNFEQVVEAALAIADLLSAAPRTKVLATSRTPLHVSREHEYLVPPLTLPKHGGPREPHDLLQFEAVTLYLERARAVNAAFELTPPNASVVAEICIRLDGLPLAIELAAARAKLLTPQATLARLDHRLALLTGGPRDRPSRQQTLRATIDWSHDLLAPIHTVLFRRLGVFAGGFELEAAEAICAGDGIEPHEILDALGALVDGSLLKVEEQEGEPRYGLLETIREFAWERLEESGERIRLQDRHRDFFVAIAERAEIGLAGNEPGRWLGRLERDRANLQAALGWSAISDPETALRLVSHLSDFWIARGHLEEGRRSLDLALGAAQDRTKARARALISSCGFDFRAGSNAAATALAEESLSIYREHADGEGASRSLHFLGVLAWVRGENDLSVRLLEESLEFASRGGFEIIRASALHSLGILRWFQGHDDAAGDLIRASLGTLRAVGEGSALMSSPTNLVVSTAPWPGHDGVRIVIEDSIVMFRRITPPAAVGYVLANLGSLARSFGDAVLAEASLREGLGVFKAIGDEVGVGQVVGQLGNLAAAFGDGRLARRLLEESLEMRRRIGETRALGNAVGVLGNLAVSEGDHDAAGAFLEEAHALFEQSGDRPAMSTNLTNLGNLSVARGELERAVSQWEESIELLRVSQQERWIPGHMVDMGQVLGFLGDAERARRVIKDAVGRFRRMGEERGVQHGMEALARLGD